MKNNKKLDYLDGIRGLMAINVMICHFICVYYPQMYSESWTKIYGGGEANLFAMSPLTILVNGDIAVRYFFVLTGFLIGRSVILSSELRGNDILKKSVNRYMRLLPICFMATAFTVITMMLNLQYHLDIVKLAKNGVFMIEYCNFKLNILNVILNLFITPFFRTSDFVGPFWTIRYEMWGYIFTLLAACCLRKSKLRRIAYILIAILISYKLDINYFGFFAGLLVADIVYVRDNKTTLVSALYEQRLYKFPTVVIMSIIGIYFASCPLQATGIHEILKVFPNSVVRTIGCSILIFCLTQSKHIYKIFEAKPLMYLGSLSFSIYAFHWPLMLSLEAGLFKLFATRMTYNVAAITSFIITAMVIVPVAHFAAKIEKKMRLNADKLIDKTSLDIICYKTNNSCD